MDWKSLNFDWNRARGFLVTAEEGSLSAAARALGLAQPTLGRQVSALEEELGVALFERAGKGLVLTPNGLALLDHVRAMGEAAGRLSLTASGRSDTLEGSVCITATETASCFFLAPIVAKLRRAEPGIEVEIIASDDSSDLRRREADIAVRNFRPTQPDLIARRLTDMQGYLYAADSYLESIGNPTTPEGFASADFIGFPANRTLIDALRAVGIKLTERNFPIISANHLVQWQLVKLGAGIGVHIKKVGDPEPGVSRAIPFMEALPIETWLVTHREVKTNRRIRRVFDFLEQELSALFAD